MAMEAGQRAEAAAPPATQEAETGSAVSISAAWTTHTVPAHMRGPSPSSGRGPAPLGTLGTAVRGMLAGAGASGGDRGGTAGGGDKEGGQTNRAPTSHHPSAAPAREEGRACRTLYAVARSRLEPPALTAVDAGTRADRAHALWSWTPACGTC